MNIQKKYLTEKVILIESRVDNNGILRILTQDKQINKTDLNYSYYKKLADWANINQNKTGPIDLSTITLSNDSLITSNKLSKNTNHLGHTLSQLKNLMDQEGKYDSSSAKSNLIQKTTLEILAGVSGIKGNIVPTEAPKEEPDEEPENTDDTNDEVRPELYSGMDWAAEKEKRLANAGNTPTADILNQFYTDYYSIEYAGGTINTPGDDKIIAKLKSLDSVLVQEFNKLGYSPDINPFAQFLKNLIAHRRDIFNKLTTNTYGAIHNSFIKGYITGNMLGNFDDSSSMNILFCTDLYNRRGLDIVNYLSLQNTIYKKAAKNTKYYKNPWLLTAKVLIQQNQSGDTFAEKVDALLDAKKVILPVHENAKMRATSEINELYRYVFNSSITKDSDTVEDEDNIHNDADDTKNETIDIIASIAKRDKIVLSMIRYILDQPNFKKEYQKQTAVYEKWLEEISYKRNERNIEKSRRILMSDNFKINTDDMPKLIKKLIAIYNKANKKDKAKN